MLHSRAEHQQPAEERRRTEQTGDDHHVGLILDGDRVVGVERKSDRKTED